MHSGRWRLFHSSYCVLTPVQEPVLNSLQYNNTLIPEPPLSGCVYNDTPGRAVGGRSHVPNAWSQKLRSYSCSMLQQGHACEVSSHDTPNSSTHTVYTPFVNNLRVAIVVKRTHRTGCRRGANRKLPNKFCRIRREKRRNAPATSRQSHGGRDAPGSGRAVNVDFRKLKTKPRSRF